MPTISGEQYVIAHEGLIATIAEVGATLRNFTSGSESIIWGFGEEELCGGGRGQVLAPWPNRLQDGLYRFEDLQATVPIDELNTHCAIHGLVRWLKWQVVAQEQSKISLRCPLAAQPGYPFCLELELDYEIGADGLLVRTRARNVDGRRIPFAIGFHPYLMGAGEGIDEALLVIPARRRLRLDSLGLPFGEQTEATDQALCSEGGLQLSDQVFDDCFTELDVLDGRWEVRFVPSPEQGATTVLWAEEAFRYVMCFTGDTLGAGERRRAVAIEPMTSPPNALHSGKDVIVLEPGQQFSAAWGLSVRP